MEVCRGICDSGGSSTVSGDGYGDGGGEEDGMTKAEIIKRGKNRGKLRKNPAFMPGEDFIEFAGGLAGDMLIRQALQGCTMNEKSMVAILIPEILKVIRAGGKVQAIIESKALPEGEKETKL